MRTARWAVLLIGLLAALAPAAPASAALPRAHPAAAPSSLVLRPSSVIPRPSSIVRLRIGVTRDGIARLTPADLAAAGADPAAVDPRTFSLSSLGRPVAIRVTGEEDGRFDAGDLVLFFGRRFRGPEMEQKYTDERVYWLEIGGQPGPRIADADAAPVGDLTPPADVLTTLHAEENRLWWSLTTLTLDTQDTWFWERLTPMGAGSVITADLHYEVPDPAPAAAATLRLEQIARTFLGHRTTAAVNGAAVLDATWSGRVRSVLTAAVPAGVLVSGSNTVAVGAWALPTTSADDIEVNFWELDYRRLFRAWQGRFDFTAELPGPQEYLIGGWASAAVAVWEVTDPLAPRWLTGALVQPDAAGYSLRFRGAGAAAAYWLQEAGSYLAPDSVRLRGPTGLAAPAEGADAVLVTVPELRAAAERLAAWHRSHGRRALVAEFQDVCDEFNAGITHPRAVPAMLAWAAEHWPGPAPRFLTLVGDGHWNMKGYNPDRYPPQPNPIPPYLDWADPWQGEVPADALYGDLDGDGVPEVAVGRLAVNTPAEADAVVDKIIAYDQELRGQPWQRRALFIADNPDVSGDFPAVSDEFAGSYLPPDLTAERVYLPGRVPEAPATDEQIIAARSAISAALQSGVWLVQYTGHGSPMTWAAEAIWRTSDVPGLHNGDRLPVVMTFACLDGYFAHPDPVWRSVAELMQRQAGGGSAAAISASGLGATPDQREFRRILMTVLFDEGVRELGTALTVTKQRFAAVYGAHYLVKTMMLYGDPAMRLPARQPRFFLPLALNAP